MNSGLYQRIKCPDCEWAQFEGSIDSIGMTPCNRCNSTGFIFKPVADITQVISEMAEQNSWGIDWGKGETWLKEEQTK